MSLKLTGLLRDPRPPGPGNFRLALNCLPIAGRNHGAGARIVDFTSDVLIIALFVIVANGLANGLT